MAKSKKAVGTRFFTEGTQNQKILAKYWGTGKAFTMDDLRDKLDIASPGARLTEIREAGFNVVSKTLDTDMPGRPALSYTIAKRRAFSI